MTALRDRLMALAAGGRRARLARPGPGGRLDAGLLLLVAGLAGGLGGAGYLAAGWIDAAGLFDPPLVHPAPDRRILDDVRAGTSPFVDAVRLDDRRALIARSDGEVVTWDVTTGLFGAERLPGAGDGLSGQVSLLSLGCGPEGSDGVLGCGAGPALAVTDRGGLALRQGDRWSVLLSDDAWTGPDGKPVEGDDVTAWAASQDGALVLAAAGDRLALFDQRTSRWQPLTDPGRFAPRHIRWAGGAFWLAGEGGIDVLRPGSGAARTPVPGADGDILSLTAMPPGQAGLLALRRAACAVDDAPGCLTILALDPRGGVRVLAGEDQVSPALSAARTEHAALQAGRLVLLGEAGVHVYDPDRRNWTRIEAAAVDAFHGTAGGDSLLIAAGGRFLRMERGRVAAERRLAQPLMQVLPGADGRALGLDRAGQIWDLAADPLVLLTPADPGLPAGARFRTGAVQGDTVVLFGPQGVALHDTRARRYAWQPVTELAPDLAGLRDPRLVGGAGLWLADMATGRVWLGAVQGDWPDRRLVLSPHADLGAALRSAHPAAGALEVVTTAGRPHRVIATAPGQALPLTGPQPRGTLPVTAVAGDAGAVVVASGGDLAVYDLTGTGARGWRGPFPGPGGPIAALAQGPGQLYALTGAGGLYGNDGTGWQALAGAGPVAAMSSADLTDAQAVSGMIHLAGRGQVQAWDVATQGFAGQWGGGRGAVRLAGALGGRPVWLSDGRLRAGDDLLSGPADRVMGAWAGPGGPVWLARDGERSFAATATGCLFRGTAAPTGALVDARALPGDRVLALTRDGAGLHDPALRRWTAVPAEAAGPETRLDLIGGHLIRRDPGRFAALPLGAVPVPDNCDSAGRPLPWALRQEVAQAVVDTVGGRALLLLPDGTVAEWTGGGLSVLLDAPGPGPDPATLLRVVQAGDALVLAARDALWRYDLPARRWTPLPFAGGPAQVAGVDVVIAPDGRPQVTVWDVAGAAWGGEAAGATVALSPLALPGLPQPAQPADAITDIAALGDRLAILGTAEVELFAPSGGPALVRLALPPAGPPRQLARIEGVADPVLVEGGLDRPARLHVLADLSPGRRPLAAAAFAYAPGDDRAWALATEGQDTILWRIDAAGGLWRCPVVAGGAVPADCTARLAPPEPMQSGDLRAVRPVAGAAGENWLLLTDRLLRLGPDLRPIARIGGLSPAARLLSVEGRVLLWHGPGGPLVDPAGAGRIADAVRDPRLRGGHLWANLPGGLARWQDGALVLVDGAVGIGAGGAVLRIDAAGRVRRADGTAPVPGLILTDIVAVAEGPWMMGAQARPGLFWQDRAGRIWFGHGRDCPRPADDPLADPHDALPRPASLPCAARMGPLAALGPGEILLEYRDGTLVTDRRVWVPDPVTGGLAPDPVSEPPSDQAAEGLARRVVGGELAPATLAPAGPGRVQVSDGSAAQTVAGGSALRGWPAWDRGWIGWDRAAGGVRLGLGADAPRLTPAEAVDGGRFLPVVPGRMARLGPGTVALLNPHGLWHVGQGGQVQRVAPAFGPATGLAGGRFLSDGVPFRGQDARTGAVSGDDDRTEVTVGDLHLTGRLRGGGVAADWRLPSGPAPAFAARGFAFDDRRAVGVRDGHAVLLTPIGLIPAQGMAGGLATPADARTLEVADGQLHLRQGASGGWLRLDGDIWTPAPAPDADRVLAEADGRIWRRVGGRAEVVPRDPAGDWRVVQGLLDFPPDQLRALAATPAQVVAMTGAGTHAAPTLAGIIGPPVAPSLPATHFDAMEAAPGDWVIWAVQRTGLQVWTGTAWAVPDPARRPWVSRRAAEAGGLRIGFDGVTPLVEVLADTPGSPRGWLPLNWRAGERLPFDRLRAVWAEGGRVWLATDFGLREIAAAAGVGLRLTVIPPGIGLTQVGRPAADPARLLARGPQGACLDLAAPSSPAAPSPAAPSPAACAPGSPALNRRLVLDSPLWRWTDGTGGVAAAYRLADGTDLPLPLPLQGGFPHDRLAGRMACSGTEWELWADLPVVARVGGQGPGRLDRLPAATMLHCQPGVVELGGGMRLPSGAMALAAGQGMRQDGGAWVPLTVAEVRAATDRAAGLVPWEAARLRLRLDPGGAPLAEHRDQSDSWRPLALADGRIAADVLRGLAVAGGQMVALTPAGLAPLVQRGRSLLVDPDRLRLATPADPQALADCLPDRIGVLDGGSQGLPAGPGAPLMLRCDDGRLWTGDPLGARDRGALTPATDDPFVAARLVDGDGWEVDRAGATTGLRGSLAFRFRDEGVGLSGGRFALDDWTGLAAPLDDTVEIVTAGHGWWRQAGGDLALSAARRPPAVPAAPQVRRLTADRDATGGLLCLETAGGRQVLAADGRLTGTETCRDWTGADAIWTWRQGEAGPEATGLSLNGVALERRLVAGRFADLTVTGAPAAEGDGRVLAPIDQGVLVLDRGRPAGIWAGTPGALARGAGGGTVLVGAGVDPLDGGAPACAGLTALPPLLPPGARALRAAPGPANTLRLLLQTGDGRLPLLLPCARPEAALATADALEVGDRARFRAQGPGLAPLLVVSAESGRLTLRMGDWGLTLPLAQTPVAVLGMAEGRATLVVTPQDLLRVETDAAITALARAGSVPPPPGPLMPPVPAPPVGPAPANPAPRAPSAVVPPPPAPPPATPPPAAPADTPAVPDAPAIRQVQRALQAQGFYPGTVDGIAGPRTRAAISRWQAAQGHPATGNLTAGQMALLLGPAP